MSPPGRHRVDEGSAHALPNLRLKAWNLQRLPAEAPPIFVTLNPPRPPAPDKTIRQLQMAHPVSSCAAYDAQQKLHTVQVTHTGRHMRLHVCLVSGKERMEGDVLWQR